MARACCHKLELFCALWSEQDEWNYVFQGGDIVSFIPSHEYTDFFLGLAVDDIAVPRADQINQIEPGAPTWEVITESLPEASSPVGTLCRLQFPFAILCWSVASLGV